MSIYSVDTDSFNAALAKLVVTFIKENPSIGRMRVVLDDGSKVTIDVAAPKKTRQKGGG